MKKRILSILLTLCMVLTLCPVTAFAETPGSIAITVDGFVAGKTPNDCTYTFASTIPGVTFSKDNIQYSYWDKYAADGDRHQIANNDAFQAGTLYRCVIDLDSNSLTEVPVVTVNGNTPDYCTFLYSAGVPEKLSIGCDLGTPTEPGSLAIKVDGFQVGNTPKDITFSFTSTIPGVEFSADDILRCRWNQCIVGEMDRDAWYPIPDDEVFQADTRYKCFIDLGNKGLTKAPTVTVNGKTPEYCEIATSNGVPHKLLIEYELGTPAPYIIINGPDVVCAEQDYEFSVTPAKVVRVRDEFTHNGEFRNYESGNPLDGVIPAEKYDLNQDSFELRVFGELADETLVNAIKTVQISKEHIFVDGVCGCGEVLTYTVEYIGSGDDPICRDIKTYGKALTLRGETFTMDGFVQTGWVDKETDAIYDLGSTYTANQDVTLNPVFEKLVTVTAPFTTTVKLGGNTAPGKTVFELGLIDGTGNELTYDDQYFFAEVTTDGAGSYSGVMTITATGKWLYDMLYEGAFIWQYDGEEDGWTYDDTVWGVRLYMPEVAARSADEVSYELLIYPTYVMDNGCFNLNLDAGTVEEMTFTNTYTKTVTKPIKPTEPTKSTESNPNTGATTSPQTDDNSNLTLWLALFAVSAAGVLGTGVYCKRRKSSRAK